MAQAGTASSPSAAIAAVTSLAIPMPSQPLEHNGQNNQPSPASATLPQKKTSIISSNNNDYSPGSLQSAVLSSVTALAAASPSAMDQCTQPSPKFSLPSQLGSVGSTGEECSKPIHISGRGHMGASTISGGTATSSVAGTLGSSSNSTTTSVTTTVPGKQVRLPPHGGASNNMNGGAVKVEAILSDEGSTYSNDIIYQC